MSASTATQRSGTTSGSTPVYLDADVWTDVYLDAWTITDQRTWGVEPMGDLAMFRGDSLAVTLTLTDDTFQTGDSVRFTVKRRLSDPDEAAVVARTSDDGGVTLDGATASCVIHPADTHDLAGTASLVWDWQVTTPTGVHTLDSGRLIVRPDVTRRSP